VCFGEKKSYIIEMINGLLVASLVFLKPNLKHTQAIDKTKAIGLKRFDNDNLNKHQLRFLSKHLGTDISLKNSEKLVEMYGTEGMVSIYDILENSTSLSPSKYFWLNIDPNDNGIRQTRPKWNGFAKMGMLTPTRIAHYGIGLMSLFIGTMDYIDFVVSGGAPDISIHDANLHACIHILAAFFSLFRFDYTWTKDKIWYLWMPTAREANMWPSFLIFVWYMCAINSDFMLPETSASFSCSETWFQAFSWITTSMLLYGASRTVLETESNKDISGVYKTRLSNVLQVSFIMTVPILADTLKPPILVHDPVIFESFKSIVNMYPQYSLDYIGLALMAMFIGNLVCALSSAEHHGAISKATIGDIGNVLAVPILIAPFYCVFIANEGLAQSLIDVTLQGMQSFL